MFYDVMDTAGSGLTAQRLRMDIISSNIANAETTRTDEGEPYRRQKPVFAVKNTNLKDFSLPSAFSESLDNISKGVRVAEIRRDPGPFDLVYEPGHPDADEEGYVRMPNVEIVNEMVDMISASRSYEANVSVIENSKQLARQVINIGR